MKELRESSQTTPDKNLEYIKSLNRTNMLTILLALCEDESLAKQISAKAKELLSDADSGEIEEQVFNTLNTIFIEELWENSGKDYFGVYHDETEVACDMVEDAVSELLQNMKRYRALGMKDIEKKYCVGIVAGLLRYGKEGENEFHEAAPDDPYIIADDVFADWKEHNPPEEWDEVKATFDRFAEV
jgi:hypothetical protein